MRPKHVVEKMNSACEKCCVDRKKIDIVDYIRNGTRIPKFALISF
jgi:hypothetical protein